MLYIARRPPASFGTVALVRVKKKDERHGGRDGEIVYLEDLRILVSESGGD